MEAKAGKTMNLSRNYQKLISAAVTLLGVVCIPQMLLSSGKGLDFSNSFLSVLLWGLSFPVADRALWKDKVLKGRTAWGFFGAFLFVMACLFGSRLEAAEYVDFTDWRMWVSIPFLTFFFGLLIGELWIWLEGKRVIPVCREEHMHGFRENLMVFLLFILVWGIILLAVYPAFCI